MRIQHYEPERFVLWLFTRGGTHTKLGPRPAPSSVLRPPSPLAAHTHTAPTHTTKENPKSTHKHHLPHYCCHLDVQITWCSCRKADGQRTTAHEGQNLQDRLTRWLDLRDRGLVSVECCDVSDKAAVVVCWR